MGCRLNGLLQFWDLGPKESTGITKFVQKLMSEWSQPSKPGILGTVNTNTFCSVPKIRSLLYKHSKQTPTRCKRWPGIYPGSGQNDSGHHSTEMPEACFEVVLQFKHPQISEQRRNCQSARIALHGFPLYDGGRSSDWTRIRNWGVGYLHSASRDATDWVNTIQAVAVLVYGGAKNEVSDCRHWNIQFSKWNHL